MFLDVVGTLRAEHGDRTIGGSKATLHVQRPPRIGPFILCDDIRELCRAALGGAVAGAGRAATDVEQDQPQRPADGGVGTKGGTEAAVAGLNAQPAGNRSVDHHHRRDGVGGGLDAVEVEQRIGDRLHGGDHHRQVFRPATSHHRIDGDPLHRRLTLARRQRSHHLIAGPRRCRQHLLHRCFGRWNDWQPVRPPLFVVQLIDRLIGVFNLKQGGGHRAPRRVFGNNQALVTPLTTASTIAAALAVTAGGRRPPIGCCVRAMGSSGRPRARDSSLIRPRNSSVPTSTVGIPVFSI